MENEKPRAKHVSLTAQQDAAIRQQEFGMRMAEARDKRESDADVGLETP